MPKANRKPASPKKPIAGLPRPDPTPAGPLWAGPNGKGPNGGVTQGLLSRWLTCRERARLLLVEGLRPHERFEAPIEFGQMWHAAEEAHAHGKSLPVAAIATHATQLYQRFPFQREEIHGWYEKCAALFPLYVEHWAEHDHVENRTPLLAEQAFDVPYRLPSGRTVRLRGKWDSVDLVNGGVWLQENKTKGAIDRSKIVRQLTFDLQVMLYLIALQETTDVAKAKHGGLQDSKHAQQQGVRRERVEVVSRTLEEPPQRAKGSVSRQRLPTESVGQTRGEGVSVRGGAEVPSGNVRTRRTTGDEPVQINEPKLRVQQKPDSRQPARDNTVPRNSGQDISVLPVSDSQGEDCQGTSRATTHPGGPRENVHRQEGRTENSGTPCQNRRSGQGSSTVEILAKSLVGHKIAGVRYNVVRRSTHKSVESMLKKYHEDVAAGRGEEWFARWEVEITPADVQRFRTRCLDPLLEGLCSWWDYVTDSSNRPFDWGRSGDTVGHALHWQHPFGVRNVLDEGGSTDLDECVTTGSVVGLRRVDTLFPELT